ncbi:hypothetical protein CTI12_AA517650 [Artemisia annua]|uniref:C-JID domain-containing protein n=1 Tax=Artemisia annua TaxID=35608 RepID=A0A2U1L8Z9_ARTAN|nr:hypothetical protein CTI12_AA517650 [Artemisia annua]
MGNQVKVELPLDWSFSKFRGYGICVVFKRKKPSRYFGNFGFRYFGYSLKNFDGAFLGACDPYYYREYIRDKPIRIDESDMILLHYKTSEIEWKEAKNYVTFCFNESEGFEVKEMGVRVVCDEDLDQEADVVLRPPAIPVPPTTAAQNVANIELWETCNNLVISLIESSVSESIAKSIMFIDSACEIWIQLETRFSLSNGSRKYKLSKECFEIQQHGGSVSKYYTKLKCVWEELDSMTVLPRLMSVTPEMSGFLIAVEKKKEEQSAQRSQLLLINPLPSVENACAVVQQEESQKDVFTHGHVPLVETTALYGKQENKGKCGIYGFKWHPPERCWEKVGYPVWHHKYKQLQNKSAQFKPKSGVNSGNFKRTAASVTSGATSFTFTPEQFESLMRRRLSRA